MSGWSRRRADRRSGCAQVLPLLQSYLDGALEEDTARRVSEHLEDCRRCGLEVSVYREIKAALSRRFPPVDPEAVERLRRFGGRLVDHDPLSGGPGPRAAPGG